MKKREANFELLRIVAMLMIITLHYLDKGGVLPEASGAIFGTGYIAWLLEAFCAVSVNVYVLISAYFLVESGFHLKKIIKLWLQVFFYSAGVAVVCMFTGLVPIDGMDIYRVLNYVFPVIEEHYWFVTAYFFMYLLAPFMNEGLKKLPERTYRAALLLLLLLLSVSKSILPVTLPIDRLGYDTLWFLCLYLTGAYIRLHGISFLSKKGRAVFGYVVCAAGIFGSMLLVRFIFQKTGSLEGFIVRQYQYNSLLCLAGAVCLFITFQGISVQSERIKRWIMPLAAASFGVYLLHEHIEIRYVWPRWLLVKEAWETPFFLLHWIGSIICVYLAGTLVDRLRRMLFAGIGKTGKKKGNRLDESR